MSLAKLIAHNLYVSTWIFKIDDEFNGRGHANFSVDHIKFVQELRKKKVEMNDEVIEQLIEVLQRVLPKKVRIASKMLYRNWNDYFRDFCKVGGVIEASPSCLSVSIGSPSVSFFIEPDGNIQIIGSFD